jgi:threonine synthase
MDVAYDWDRLTPPPNWQTIEELWCHRRQPSAFSGVWRFHSLLPFASIDAVVTLGEGQTILHRADAVGIYVDLAPGCLHLQYEGLNPSGSFKDNGMAAAFTHARMVGARQAACASTGNTSSSLALYCAATGLMSGVVFIGSGKISYGKLAQALDHGVTTLQIAGDFDDAMRQVQAVSRQLGIYLVNSINPFRLEGQKTIMFRVLEALNWQPPDWIVVPGGNLGNVSAFGKAFHELHGLGLLPERPRFAVINAAGADTFHRLYEQEGLRWNEGRCDHDKIDRYYQSMDAEQRKATTIASAIEINRPVNLTKALRAMEWCGGVVRSVTDQEIVDAKAQIGRGGFGCEPASAASVAGLKKLRAEGIIGRSDRVVCVLTGHSLKDPDVAVAYHSGSAERFAHILGSRGISTAAYQNAPIPVPNDIAAIIAALHPSLKC